MDWQRRLSRADAPAIPVTITNAGHTYWITPRQYRIAVKAASGWKGTIRQLAEELGYSKSGVHDALTHLDALGIVKLYTKRGRNGWTRFKVRLDAVARNNVRTTSYEELPRERVAIPRLVVRTFPTPPSWRAVGEMLKGLAGAP